MLRPLLPIWCLFGKRHTLYMLHSHTHACRHTHTHTSHTWTHTHTHIRTHSQTRTHTPHPHPHCDIHLLLTQGNGPGPGQSDSVVKIKSLPFDANQLDIIQFFEGYRLKPNGVQLVVRSDNRPTGEVRCGLDFRALSWVMKCMCPESVWQNGWQ